MSRTVIGDRAWAPLRAILPYSEAPGSHMLQSRRIQPLQAARTSRRPSLGWRSAHMSTSTKRQVLSADLCSRPPFGSALLVILARRILASPFLAALTSSACLGSKDSLSVCDIYACIISGAVAPETSRLAARAAHKSLARREFDLTTFPGCLLLFVSASLRIHFSKCSALLSSLPSSSGPRPSRPTMSRPPATTRRSRCR
jgi:hypothetical protein